MWWFDPVNEGWKEGGLCKKNHRLRYKSKKNFGQHATHPLEKFCIIITAILNNWLRAAYGKHIYFAKTVTDLKCNYWGHPFLPCSRKSDW